MCAHILQNFSWDSYVPAEGFGRDSGIKSVQQGQLASAFKKWVNKSHEESDQQVWCFNVFLKQHPQDAQMYLIKATTPRLLIAEIVSVSLEGVASARCCLLYKHNVHHCLFLQYKLEDEWPEHSSSGEYTVFKTIHAAHLNHSFRADEVVGVPDVTGGKLSWYKCYKDNNSAVSPQGREARSAIYRQQQRLFGRIRYFKRQEGQADCLATAVLTREPIQDFGTEEFEFPVYKLEAADGTKQAQEYAKVATAVPSKVQVAFDAKRMTSSTRPIKVLAKAKLPQATVMVFNK